jgi:hypothetical protein
MTQRSNFSTLPSLMLDLPYRYTQIYFSGDKVLYESLVRLRVSIVTHYLEQPIPFSKSNLAYIIFWLNLLHITGRFLPCP